MTTRRPSPLHVWDSHKHDAELHERIRELEAELAEAREQRRVDSSGLENLAESGNYWGAKWEKEHNLVVETIARAEKAEAVSRPEECPWRETDLGCPCEIPGLDNDGVRDKAIADAALRIRELEAELADLRTYRDLHYCGEKGIVERATSDLKARAEKAIKHLGSHGYPEFSDDCSECKDLASIGQLAREREASE